MTSSKWTTAAAGVLAALALTASVAAQQPGAPPPSPPSDVGVTLYETHCTTCHGESGRGDGPSAKLLSSKPADLTLLAMNNGGTFSRDAVARTIDDRGPLGGHGRDGKPVWGTIFSVRSRPPSVVYPRIHNLVSYIESIQQRPQAYAGVALYETHCTTCHGQGGTGNGPSAKLLRSTPANLTLLAKNNSGTFPRFEVARTIGGSGPIEGHGGRDTPVWGKSFSVGDESPDVVSARIQSLVSYIESIQQKP
jgi:mono/diheme cytochrome c family protein